METLTDKRGSISSLASSVCNSKGSSRSNSSSTSDETNARVCPLLSRSSSMHNPPAPALNLLLPPRVASLDFQSQQPTTHLDQTFVSSGANDEDISSHRKTSLRFLSCPMMKSAPGSYFITECKVNMTRPRCIETTVSHEKPVTPSVGVGEKDEEAQKSHTPVNQHLPQTVYKNSIFKELSRSAVTHMTVGDEAEHESSSAKLLKDYEEKHFALESSHGKDIEKPGVSGENDAIDRSASSMHSLALESCDNQSSDRGSSQELPTMMDLLPTTNFNKRIVRHPRHPWKSVSRGQRSYFVQQQRMKPRSSSNVKNIWSKVQEEQAMPSKECPSVSPVCEGGMLPRGDLETLQELQRSLRDIQQGAWWKQRVAHVVEQGTQTPFIPLRIHVHDQCVNTEELPPPSLTTKEEEEKEEECRQHRDVACSTTTANVPHPQASYSLPSSGAIVATSTPQHTPAVPLNVNSNPIQYHPMTSVAPLPGSVVEPNNSSVPPEITNGQTAPANNYSSFMQWYQRLGESSPFKMAPFQWRFQRFGSNTSSALPMGSGASSTGPNFVGSESADEARSANGKDENFNSVPSFWSSPMVEAVNKKLSESGDMNSVKELTNNRDTKAIEPVNGFAKGGKRQAATMNNTTHKTTRDKADFTCGDSQCSSPTETTTISAVVMAKTTATHHHHGHGTQNEEQALSVHCSTAMNYLKSSITEKKQKKIVYASRAHSTRSEITKQGMTTCKSSNRPATPNVYKYNKSCNLTPSDPIILSHLNSTDRRLRSTAAKTDVVIEIEGPIAVCNPNSRCQAIRNHSVYQCTISSNISGHIEKCLYYMKETFPGTNMR